MGVSLQTSARPVVVGLGPRVAAAALLLGLAACGSESERDLRVRATDEQPPAARIELRFAWPVPAAALVREQARSPASTYTLRYRIHVTSDGDALLVRTTDFELESLNGRAPQTAADRDALAPALASIESAMPAIRVARDGTFLGVSDLDGWAERAAQVVEAQIERLPEGIEGRDDALRALRTRAQMMRSQTMRPALEKTAGERWETWVRCWCGVRGTIGEGTVQATSVSLPWAPLGADVELAATVRGFVVRPATAVRVEMLGDFDPGDGSSVLTLALARAGGREFDGMTARFGRGAVFDPATMLPLHVESRLRLRHEAAEDPTETNDIRIWDFDWETVDARESAPR